MQAIILAGGFGTRLRSVLTDVPKPMAPIHNRPFLAYLIDYLISQGVTQIVLSVHYLAEQIESYFQASYRDVSIRYAMEDEPLGTGGAIINSLPLIDSSEPVFVLNGDTFLKLNYQKMFALHTLGADLTMSLRRVTDCSRYGEVTTVNNIVTAFQEQGSARDGLINAGVYLLNPAIFKNHSLPRQFSFEKDFLFSNIQLLQPRAFIVDDYFIDIGVPADYARAVVDFAI
jgi:D-glycero-alpha-D-manno-heptose 1-phosphate guanylyltransferase